MDQAIDFYFDFTSPYAYFGALSIDALAARHGRRVRWHPVLLAALFDATKRVATPFIPIKWQYVQKDLERIARRRGVPYRLPPNFPGLWLTPGRAMLWIRQAHGDELAHAFARDCFAKAFGEGIDIAPLPVLGEIAARLGISPTDLAAGVEDPAIKAAFKDGTTQALERGVFGVPYVIADGEPFWGHDRFDELDAFLSGRA